MASEMRRFMDKVRKEEGGCWIWTGSVAPSNGYGSFSYGKKTMRAHRVSYILHRDEIPEGMCVLHKCDVTACVNPDHLFLGTQLENISDRVQKGRSARGGSHGMSKLTPEEVLEIRRLSATTQQKTLARRFGVRGSTILSIMERRAWKHL